MLHLTRFERFQFWLDRHAVKALAVALVAILMGLLIFTMQTKTSKQVKLQTVQTSTTSTSTSTTVSSTTSSSTTTTTQAPIQTTQPVRTHPVGCDNYRHIVAKYFPAEQVDNALFVMSKESGCDPYAKSATNDHGLFQVHFPAHSAKVNGNLNALYDPETNARVAATIYSGSWRAWYAVCPVNGSNPYGLC